MARASLSSTESDSGRDGLSAFSWPLRGLEPVATCPVCAHGARERLYGDLRDPQAPTRRDEWTIWKCARCNAAYLDPRPTPSTIGLAYEDSYYTHQVPATDQEDGLLRAFRTRTRHGYLNRVLKYDLAPASWFGGAVLGLLRKRAEVTASSVRHLPLQREGRLLDVGAGAGSFVAYMRTCGWAAEGIDPDPAAVEVARAAEVPVRQATISEMDDAAHLALYDAITLNHVIEHLHDPVGTLRVCRRLLKPTGVLWLATPNLLSISHSIYRGSWVHLDPPRHLVLFTPEALNEALEKAGFRAIRFVRTRSNARKARAASAAIEARKQLSGSTSLSRMHRITRLSPLHLRQATRSEEIAVIALPDHPNE